MPNFTDPAPAPDTEFVNLADYKGEILVLEPTAFEENFETRNGPRDRMLTSVSYYNQGTKSMEGLGEQSIFWVKVIEQLRGALETDSVVIATLVQNGRAYELEPVTGPTRTTVEKAYSDF